MGTSASGQNFRFTATDAGVDWVSVALSGLRQQRLTSSGQRDFENMVASSLPSVEAEMLDSELAAWLETQPDELHALNLATPGPQG